MKNTIPKTRVKRKKERNAKRKAMSEKKNERKREEDWTAAKYDFSNSLLTLSDSFTETNLFAGKRFYVR